MFNVDDAIEFILEKITMTMNSSNVPQEQSEQFVLWLAIQDYVKRELPNEEGSKLQLHFPKYSREFLDAAHELFRRGILRLGPTRFESGQAQYPLKLNYVLTEFGRSWIKARASGGITPMEPGRYPQLIQEYAKLFGAGFLQRATEAIRCYHAQAYLACCAMVGAAAESILLHVAIKKSGNEDEILKEYRTSGGAGKIKNRVLQNRTGMERQHFEGIHELMKYWRDESAHGNQSGLSEVEAYMSLHLLIRHASFVRDNIEVYSQ